MWRIGMLKWIPLQKSEQLLRWNRQPDKRRLTVSFTLILRFVNLVKKADYKYMIAFFTPVDTKGFSCMLRAQPRMPHYSIVGCNNKQTNNSKATYFNLPKDPQRRKSLLDAISRDKGNLPSIYHVLISSDHFEDKCFDNLSD